MNSSTSRRKILIIEDQPSIRNILYILLAGLDCEGEVANSSEQALGMISRGSFDAVLLDLRCADLPPQEMVSRIKKISPSLVGRVLIITGEITDPKTMEWIEQQCLIHVPVTRLMQELWGPLRVMLGLASTP